MDEELYRQAKELVCETLEIDAQALDDTTHFIDDLGIDSILIIELKTRFEEKYRIGIDREELTQLNCLADIISYLTARDVQAV